MLIIHELINNSKRFWERQTSTPSPKAGIWIFCQKINVSIVLSLFYSVYRSPVVRDASGYLTRFSFSHLRWDDKYTISLYCVNGGLLMMNLNIIEVLRCLAHQFCHTLKKCLTIVVRKLHVHTMFKVLIAVLIRLVTYLVWDQTVGSICFLVHFILLGLSYVI